MSLPTNIVNRVMVECRKADAANLHASIYFPPGQFIGKEGKVAITTPVVIPSVESQLRDRKEGTEWVILASPSQSNPSSWEMRRVSLLPSETIAEHSHPTP